MFARTTRLALLLAAMAAPAMPALAQEKDAQGSVAQQASEQKFRIGLSLMGEPKYQPGFPISPM